MERVSRPGRRTIARPPRPVEAPARRERRRAKGKLDRISAAEAAIEAEGCGGRTGARTAWIVVSRRRGMLREEEDRGSAREKK